MVNGEKKIMAVIPARGGSKRIQKKNIIDFDGKPMIAWTIIAALKSKVFSDVYVSTDDEEIKKIAIDNGAHVPFLRDKNYDDHSTVSDVIFDFLEKINKNSNKIIVMLMPNCPLRDSNDIINSVDFFIKNNNNFQLSCSDFGWTNPWWAHIIDKNGKVSKAFDSYDNSVRSQDLPKLYSISGAIWIAKIDEFMKEKTFYGPNYQLKKISWKNAIDIDEYEDLELAKKLK